MAGCPEKICLYFYMGSILFIVLYIRYGFNNNINPEIISHPANCQLISQRKNSSKHMNCSITIEEL